MSTTHEAFSLPASSPGHGRHPDAFNPAALKIPGPLSPAYTYPPQSPVSSYNYGPTSYVHTYRNLTELQLTFNSSSRSRQTPILPLHHIDTITTPPPYPPLENTWNRLKLWLAREYPELGDTLNYGILPQDLAQIEMQFGFALPQAVRDSYLVADGQEAESSAGCSEGLFFGLSLLPLEGVLEEWRFWREVDDDPQTGNNPHLRDIMQSVPDGYVRKEYSQRGWLPLVVDKAGNYIGVDLNPDKHGSVGQVIVFGRDFDTKIVLWHGDGPGGWARWLANFVDELESGEGFELGQGENEDSEDELGYEAYFFDGNGRGQGDGGGESGPGGLRFTGEYRGLSPMEAWADRSVKKWYESGLIQAPSLDEKKGKVCMLFLFVNFTVNQLLQAPERYGLGILNLADSEVVVPIPVFTDLKVAEEPSALTDVTDAVSQSFVPAIAITKPPAPVPVGLPTVNDVVSLPSPPDSQRSFSEDLEAGLGFGMREIQTEVVIDKVPPRHSPTTKNVEIPVERIISIADDVHLETPPLTVENLADLLADTAPAMKAVPLQPSTPTMDAVEVEAAGSSEPVVTPRLSQEEAKEPTTTIRLVGGGGSSGVIDAIPADDAIPEPATDIMSVTSSGSNDSPSKKDKQHEKSKSSIVSLKKIANIGGGKRKKDSSSSIKETI
jgi:cell wall assembly regulator SMI1